MAQLSEYIPIIMQHKTGHMVFGTTHGFRYPLGGGVAWEIHQR